MKTYLQIVLTSLLLLLQPSSFAAEYPAQPVTVVLPVSTGSATDGLMRILAQKVSDATGYQFVIRNEPGASGVIATDNVVRASADGHTLIALSTNQVINANLRKNLQHDIRKELTPIARLILVPMVLCLNPSVPAKSLQEFIDLAKEKPDSLNFGSPGEGSTAHLSTEMLVKSTGIKATHIPYKAVSQAQTDLIGGRLDFMFIVPSAAIAQMQNGGLRCLAVTTETRLPQLPELPTVAEAGVPGYESVAWIGIAGPTGIPAAIADKISSLMTAAVFDPEVQKRILGMGLIPAPMERSKFTDYYQSDFVRWQQTIKDANIALMD